MIRHLQKLRTMSGEEIGARLKAASYRVYERRLVGSASQSRARRRDPLISANGSSFPDWSFLASIRDLERVRATLNAEYASECRECVARADRALAGEIRLFGRERRIGREIDWIADPVTGGRWPLVYHGDVPVSDAARAPGDPKDVWELNRHQYLLDLAKAWLITRREEYAAAIDDAVTSWIASNPYAVGINWAGPLEVAYRALSWIWVLALTRDRAVPDAARRRAWVESLLDHGRFLHRHLELYESPFNHLIGEATVLYVLGTVLSSYPEAAGWRRRGHDVLESRVSQQFYADGGSVEQAVGYHHATLGFYLIAVLTAKQHNDAFSDAVWRTLERAIDFSMRLSQPDGSQPALGDNDDARPLAFDVPDTWDYRHVQAAGAVLFSRGDFKWVAGRFPEDAFWLLGPDRLNEFRTLPAQPPAEQSSALRASGYVVMRSAWDRNADYVCFDCGEQAGGLRTDTVPSAAHGHADALSIVVSLQGRPVLVDPGFYSYNGERAWERHFRETAAHNTIRIDGRDQAEHLEKMAWIRVPRVRLEACDTDAGHAWAVASHDGYTRLPGGVTHRRTVWLRPNGYVLIHDVLTGTGTHDAELCFQFAPGLKVVAEADRVIADGRYVLAWQAGEPLMPSCATGGATPGDGWVAPRLGARQPAARVVLRATFSGTLEALSVLADAQVWSGGIQAIPEAAARLKMRLTSPLLQDVVDAGAAQPPPAPAGDTDATLAVWRTSAGALIESRRIGGTFMHPEVA